MSLFLSPVLGSFVPVRRAARHCAAGQWSGADLCSSGERTASNGALRGCSPKLFGSRYVPRRRFSLLPAVPVRELAFFFVRLAAESRRHGCAPFSFRLLIGSDRPFFRRVPFSRPGGHGNSATSVLAWIPHFFPPPQWPCSTLTRARLDWRALSLSTPSRRRPCPAWRRGVFLPPRARPSGCSAHSRRPRLSRAPSSGAVAPPPLTWPEVCWLSPPPSPPLLAPPCYMWPHCAKVARFLLCVLMLSCLAVPAAGRVHHGGGGV